MMSMSPLALKNFFPLLFLALFTLTACSGGGSGVADSDDVPNGATATSEPPAGGQTDDPTDGQTDDPAEDGQTDDPADETDDPIDEPPIIYTTQDRTFYAERADICTAWLVGRDLKLFPHENRDAGGQFTEVLLYKEQRDEFCNDNGTDNILPEGINKTAFVTHTVARFLCVAIAESGDSVDLLPDDDVLYEITLDQVEEVDVALTRAQFRAICGGDVLASDFLSYYTGYLNVDEMQAINLPSSVNRTQPALETLRQSSISLSHLFQRGAMQDNMIQTHDEFGDAVSFQPLQAQSIKSSYGLSDAMHDLTFTAKRDEVFNNEQANLSFTTNKYDSGQSNLNASYQFGNMFISGDFRPMMKESEMQFMQISDSARDVGTLRVSHKISDTVSFTQKAGTGTFTTGNRFDEIATALSYNQDGKKLSIGAGRLREYNQFLGSVTSGAYALDEATESAYLSLHADMKFGKNINMQANYSAMNSNVSLHHDDFVRVNGLRSDSYDIKLQSKMKSGNLSLQYLVPLAVTDGTWQQRNVINLQDSISNQDLSVNQRHQQWNLHYQSDGQHHIHVFATLTRDENYSNIAGLESTQIMAGLSKKF